MSAITLIGPQVLHAQQTCCSLLQTMPCACTVTCACCANCRAAIAAAAIFLALAAPATGQWRTAEDTERLCNEMTLCSGSNLTWFTEYATLVRLSFVTAYCSACLSISSVFACNLGRSAETRVRQPGTHTTAQMAAQCWRERGSRTFDSMATVSYPVAVVRVKSNSILYNHKRCVGTPGFMRHLYVASALTLSGDRPGLQLIQELTLCKWIAC